MKKRMLLVADFACKTGFARVAENIAKELSDRWDISVLAINYSGDPHPLQKQFTLFVPTLGGDVYGINRITTLAPHFDILFFINDVWILDMYFNKLKAAKIYKPTLFYTPIDAKHIKRAFIEPLLYAQHGVAYTEFGKQELLKGGWIKPMSVIPHGVDTKMYYPINKQEARKVVGIPDDQFVVLCLARNQARKRLDLLFYYFAEWVKRTNKPDNVKLYYHGALQDMGWDLLDLANVWGIEDRIILTSSDMTMHSLIDEQKLKYVYSVADVFTTPCASEGWCLPLHEAMACAVPCLVPNSSALAEWPKGGVDYIEVYEDLPNVNLNGVNTIMDTPRLDSFIEKMERIYNDEMHRKDLSKRGFEIATDKKFKWRNIANSFDNILNSILEEKETNIESLRARILKDLT
jgi:D-inositol-3-phosphate glycosyltransferase